MNQRVGMDQLDGAGRSVQAPGFDAAAASDLHAKSKKAAKQKPTMSATTEHSVEEPELQHPAWGGRKQLIKVLLIVAATAASLYLLKRRFF